MKKLPAYRLPLWATLLLAVLLSGCITLLALWCQPNALRSVLAVFRAQPLLIVLNAMPIGLLVLALTALLRNVFFGAAAVNLAVCCMAIVNRVKIEVRDEPLFPRDFALLKEAGSILEDYNLQFPVRVIALVVLATAALAVLGIVVKARPFPVEKLRGWTGRAAGAAAGILVLAGLIFTVYASNDLYNSFRTSNPYYVPSVFNELGFPYCFCHQFTTYPVDRPEGFNKAEAEVWETGGKAVQGGPHVIFVMNEAFSDITEHPAFAYTDRNDPLQTLHALQSSPNTVASGGLIVPNFAAGTANTEFDVMTGIQTNALAATTTSAFRVVNRALDSLFRVYGESGYRAAYYHPGDDWFYNRENVVAWMGADESLFLDGMPDFEAKGRWVTDDYMAGRIESAFESAVAAGEPLFLYATTIQNHMSYTEGKYGEGYDFPAVPLNAPVSPETEMMLRVYAEGVRDADAMLGRLTDYFSDREEPVVLVYYGDHLPYLGDNQSGYRELGFTDDPDWATLSSYRVPYLVWANDAAQLADTDLTPDGDLSAAFLGSAVLELTGHLETSPWFSFLNDLRRETPVVQPTTAQTDAIAQWRRWSYYKLKYQTFD